MQVNTWFMKNTYEWWMNPENDEWILLKIGYEYAYAAKLKLVMSTLTLRN
jgi:hypothetical protein